MGMGRGAAAGSGSGFTSVGLTSPLHSPKIMTKPPALPSAPKPKATTVAPPVATFQTKTFDYKETKNPASKGPDILM